MSVIRYRISDTGVMVAVDTTSYIHFPDDPGAMPYGLSNNSIGEIKQELKVKHEQEYENHREVLYDEYPTVSHGESSSSDDDKTHNQNKHGFPPTKGMEGSHGSGHGQHGELAQARREIKAQQRENARLNQLLKLGFRADQQFGNMIHDDKDVAKVLQKPSIIRKT